MTPFSLLRSGNMVPGINGGGLPFVGRFGGGSVEVAATGPTLTLATIEPDGRLRVVHDRNVTGNAGYSLTASGGNPTLSSPEAGDSARVIFYTLSRVPDATETVTIAYDSGTGDIVSASGAVELEDIASQIVYVMIKVAHQEPIPNPAQNTTFQTTQAGAWGDTATWVGGDIPTATDDAIVLHAVSVGDTAATCRGLLVASGGEINFATDANTRLTVTTVAIIDDGEIKTGAGAAVDADKLCELVIRDTALPSQALDPLQLSNGLVMTDTAVITMIGATKTCKASELRLSVEPLEGHTTLTFETNPLVGWRAGDKLYIPPTEPIRDVATNTAFGVPYEGEEAEIQSVTDNVVTLTAPLTMDHLGAYDDDGTLRFLPHAINLTRNVVIRSETEGATVRGHTAFASRVDPDIRYVLFKNLGRTQDGPLDDTTVTADRLVSSYGTNQRGRYPVHFHHWWGPVNALDTGYQGYMEGCAVDDGLKWSVALHEACYLHLLGLNIYDCQYSGIQLEAGNEAYNRIEDCVIMRFVGRDDAASTVCNGITLMEGQGNEIVNCVTAHGHTSAYLPHGIHLDHLRRSQPGFAGGPYRVPLFRGADLHDGTEDVDWESVAAGAMTYTNDGNEGYALTKGLSYDHVGGGGSFTVTNYKYWGGYQESVFVYGGDATVTVNGLEVRKVAAYGFWIDSQEALVTLRNGDIQTGSGGFGLTAIGVVHSGGMGEGFALLVEDSTVIAPVNVQPDFPTSVGTGTDFNLYSRVTHLRNVTATKPTGQVTPVYLNLGNNPRTGSPGSNVPMLPAEVFVEDCTFGGVATGNLQAFWNDQGPDEEALCEADIDPGGFSEYAALTCGLTNAQALATDGRTTGGELMPSDATTLTGVTGGKVRDRVTGGVAANGTSVTLTFSGEVTTDGTGFSGSGTTSGAFTLAYVSGSGSNQLVFTASKTLVSGETVTVSYSDATGNVAAAVTTAWALPSFSNLEITNSSEQAGGAFSPDDIAGLKFWAESDTGVYSDAGTTPAADTDTVAQWNDQSANADHAVQAGAGVQLEYRTGIINSLPVIRGDGTNKFLAAPVSGASAYTAYIVVIPRNLDADRFFLEWRLVGNGTPILAQCYFDNAGRVRHRVRNDAGSLVETNTGVGAAVVGTPLIVRVAWDGSDIHVRVNDGTPASAAFSGTTTVDQIEIPSAQGAGYQLDHATILLYDSDVTGANDTDVMTYLNTKYNVF